MNILIVILLIMQSLPSAKTVDDFHKHGEKCIGHGEFSPLFFKYGKPGAGESLVESFLEAGDLESLFINLGVLRCIEHLDGNRPDFDEAYFKFQIIGYADSMECPGEMACMQIALNRAHTVRDWLIAQGIPVSNLLMPAGVVVNSPEIPATPNNRARSRSVIVDYWP